MIEFFKKYFTKKTCGICKYWNPLRYWIDGQEQGHCRHTLLTTSKTFRCKHYKPKSKKNE